MHKPVFLLAAALAVVTAACPATAQKFIPKSILFKGAPEYSSDELLAAAGLKKGVALAFADMQGYTKRLMDTGVFSTTAFKFDGQDLTFLLAPSTDLYPIRLENLPLATGKDLDAKLHEQVPLYHGKVPAAGSLTDAVCATLQKMLADEGLQATVTAMTGANLATQKVNVVIFSTVTPVLVSIVHMDGVSGTFHDQVQLAMNETAAEPYDTENTASNLERVIKQFYEDRGYAAAKVQVAPVGKPAQMSGSIFVPLSIQVQEGRMYKVQTIHLPAGTPVTREDIDKALNGGPSNVPEGVRVRSIWVLISSRYKAKGNLDCKVTPHEEFDEAAATVSYTVDVDPGPVYHLAFVKFDGVSDELRALLIKNWQMLPGDPFDESYVSNFIMKVQTQDPALRPALANVKTKFDAMEDPQTHTVNLVIHLEK